MFDRGAVWFTGNTGFLKNDLHWLLNLEALEKRAPNSVKMTEQKDRATACDHMLVVSVLGCRWQNLEAVESKKHSWFK